MSQPIIDTVPSPSFADQRPGTSGLRKRVSEFSRPGYLENFIQALFDTLGNVTGRTLILGGDGRYFNRAALQIILRMAAAHGFACVRVGQGGLLSTPAASLAIRRGDAIGGIILSASHNPGGPEGDFGVKFNAANGGPANLETTEAIYARTLALHAYRIVRADDIDLDEIGVQRVGDMDVVVFDPVAGYADLMQHLFDFDRIHKLFSATGFEMRFDGMHAVTGPYACRLFEDILGAPPGTVIRGRPLPDFGGAHPDPNLANVPDLTAALAGGVQFAAASDGDGDRNLVMGQQGLVSPSDSLAIMAANAHLLPGYRHGLAGVARSMPTSRAADRVADAMGIDCFETPTGWKFFGNLLDAGRITLCGEESFGSGSDHVREKDGLWAVLFWLNLVALRGEPVGDIVAAHWRRFGRDYYSRHDYEGLDTGLAAGLMADLRARLPNLPGRDAGSLRIGAADDFRYVDPVDGSVAEQQGIRVMFTDGSRAVFRLSGTGTRGATLRIYLERFEGAVERQGKTPSDILRDVAKAAEALSEVHTRTGRHAADVVT